MRYVIDANVLMGALISGKSVYKTVFGTFDLVMPDFGLVEIEKYRQTIFSKSRLNATELRQFTVDLFEHLTILPNYFLTVDALTEAGRLIADTDPKDIAYLALAIQTDTILLTRDRPIYSIARQRGFRRIVLFDDFMRWHS